MCIMNELVRVQYKYRQTKEAEWAKQFGGFTWLCPSQNQVAIQIRFAALFSQRGPVD